MNKSPQDLSNAEMIAAIKSMQVSVGWALMLQVFMDNKEYLENLIITAIDPDTDEKMTPKEQDHARDKLKLTNEVINTPAGYIEALEQAGEEEIVDFDPYK